MGTAVPIVFFTCLAPLKESCFQMTSSEENNIVHLLKSLIPSFSFPCYFVLLLILERKHLKGTEAASPPLVAVTAFLGAWEGKNLRFKRKIFIKMKQQPARRCIEYSMGLVMQVAAVPFSSRQEGQEGSLPPGGTGDLGRNTEFHDSQQMCRKGAQITYLKSLLKS